MLKNKANNRHLYLQKEYKTSFFSNSALNNYSYLLNENEIDNELIKKRLSFNMAESLYEKIKDECIKMNKQSKISINLNNDDFKEILKKCVLDFNGNYPLAEKQLPKYTTQIQTQIEEYCQEKKQKEIEKEIEKKQKEINEQGVTEIYSIYETLDDCLYRDPDENEKELLTTLGIPEGVKLFFRQQAELQIEMQQRATSAVHAAWLAYRTFLKNSSRQCSLTQNTAKQLEAFREELFGVLSCFNKMEKKEEFFDNLISHLEAKLKDKLQLSEDAVKKTLNHFESFANWERMANTDVGKNGFAVISEINKKDKKYLLQYSQPQSIELTKEQIGELKEITSTQKPKWFLSLPELSQAWLEQNLEKIKKNELGCPPSILRCLPGVANFRADKTIAFNSKREILFNSSTNRSSVATAVEVKDKADRIRLTEQNKQQLEKFYDYDADKNENSGKKTHFNDFFDIENFDSACGYSESTKTKMPMLFQRLLSPSFWDRWPILRSFVGSDNNSRMLDESRTETDKDNLYSNWPINAVKDKADDPFKQEANSNTRSFLNQHAKKVLGGLITKGKLSIREDDNVIQTAINSDETKIKVGTLKQLAGKIENNQVTIDIKKQNKPLFQAALLALSLYESIWDQKSSSNLKNPHELNVQLLMAALESIIAEGLGLKSDHGCKSAKDRYAIMETMKKSLLLFMENNNTPLNLTEKTHIQELSQYFATVFNSGYHQNVVSNYSSYGAHALQDGRGVIDSIPLLKFSRMIPETFARAIAGATGEDILKDDGALATADAEISRQNELGHTAKLSKKANFIERLKEFFNFGKSKKKLESQFETEAIKWSSKESPLTLPEESESKKESIIKPLQIVDNKENNFNKDNKSKNEDDKKCEQNINNYSEEQDDERKNETKKTEEPRDNPTFGN